MRREYDAIRQRHAAHQFGKLLHGNLRHELLSMRRGEIPRRTATIAVQPERSCEMGFEQLAELKKQLAQQRADAKPQGKSPSQGQSQARSSAKPSSEKRHGQPGQKPASGKPAGHAGGKPSGKPQQGRRPAPAVDAKPVNPTVLAIGKLQRRFPAAFPKNPAPKVPLKIGIFKDLVAHTAELSLDEAQLRDAIKEWCRGSRYWASLVTGAKRVDLTGAEAGEVTEQQAAGAVRLDQARRTRAAKSKAGEAKRDEAAKVEGEANADTAAQPQAEAAQAADAADVPAETDAAAQAAAPEAPAASEAAPDAASADQETEPK
ncbi:ProQ/FINO family protein [Burkholderia sp. 22PA0099]